MFFPHICRKISFTMCPRTPECSVIFSGLLLLLLLHAAASSAQEQTMRFTQLPKDLIESRLHRFSRKNEEREITLKQMFVEAGCDGEHISEQPMKDRKQGNVICIRQGSTDSTVIIGAHFDHVDAYGLGVVDNWSGASLLPSLFESLKPYSPKHTLRFIGFAEEEQGLIGSDTYARQLTPEEIQKIRLVIDLDCLGLGPTEIWQTHSDPKMMASMKVAAQLIHVPLAIMNADQVGDDDSTSFRKRHIPTLMLHSITQETLGILHSPKDNISQVRLDDYYDSYRLIDVYLRYIDGLLD